MSKNSLVRRAFQEVHDFCYPEGPRDVLGYGLRAALAIALYAFALDVSDAWQVRLIGAYFVAVMLTMFLICLAVFVPARVMAIVRRVRKTPAA